MRFDTYAICFKRPNHCSAIALPAFSSFHRVFARRPIFHRLTSVACPMFEWLLRREMRQARGQFASYHSITLPHYHCSTVSRYHSSTVPLYHCTTVPLKHCTTEPLYHLPQYHCSTVSEFYSTTLPEYDSIKVPEYHHIIPHYTTIKEYQSTREPQNVGNSHAHVHNRPKLQRVFSFKTLSHHLDYTAGPSFFLRLQIPPVAFHITVRNITMVLKLNNMQRGTCLFS